ncbi:MAG TPA: EAL domain-containing protein, partial [Ilumatobacteraceae bacterium]
MTVPAAVSTLPAVGESSGRTTLIALGAFAVVIAAHATGVLGDVTYTAVTLAGVVCATAGLRRHRPTLQWPWWALVATGLLWTASSVLSDATHATGNLTSSRSLLPDLFAIPGYCLFGAALYGLLRARRGPSEPGALLDGIMLGAGALLVVNELLITPALGIKGAWVMARISIAIYPALSMCLLVLAARLAFTSGERSPAFRLLLLGTLGLLVGDVVFALGEVSTIPLSQSVLEVPYLLVPACISSAVLHPSIRFVSRPLRRRDAMLGRGRLFAVAGALLAPIVVLATDHSGRGLAISLVLCLILAVTAIVRLWSAMRSQAALEARLSHQATHDELTGLPSRALIVSHLEHLLAKAVETDSPIAVLFIDLDQFKLVNDSMGHSIGDQLLIQAAERISSCVGPDDLVGRISGDEFIVVVSCDTDAAVEVGELIRRHLAESFYLDSGEVFISVSIGATIAFGHEHAVATTLIQEADTAMYRSKDSGRDQVTVFDSSMRERVARRVELERSLRQALTQRRLQAFFQPLVSLPSGKVHGFEALVRWKDHEHMVSPAEFIPVAEESGLIVPLGAFMLDEACRNLAHWRRTVPGAERLYVSVNLSARQLRESDIVDTVADTLAHYKLTGDALWLEITESLIAEDSVATAAVMTGLRSLGVRLAVDDFGTGYSS